MRFKRLAAVLLTLCLTLELVAVATPKQAEAAWDTALGYVTVTHLDNDFKDGKFRFNIKIKYEKYAYEDDENAGIQITDVRLLNSAGKKVTSWKSKRVLTTSGETVQHYALDFSTLPSDTYKFCYTLAPDYSMFSKSYSISVKHSAGSITFNSAKYEYTTSGEKKAVVKFNMKQLKGYTTKVQIFDANGNLVRTFPNPSKPSGNDIVYTVTWGMTNDKGALVKKGTYTMKITCNGKSCSRNLKIDPN